MHNKLWVSSLSSSSQHLKSVINGKALLFCENSKKHKKRDAIDTNQITPSSYCPSDSLDGIDENRKIGAFKYLVPNFRERVHQGANFLIVRKHFEMNPVGIKGIRLEADKEIAIVCTDGLGEIFRQDANNLDIYIIHSSNAAEEAADEDEFQFNFATAELINLTKNKNYHLSKMNEKEKELLSLWVILSQGEKEFLEDRHKSDFKGSTPIHDLKNSNDKSKLIYSRPKKYNTINTISVPHHIETNMGRWIHFAVSQNEEVYDPSNLNGKKITTTKEHSIYIYNPDLDNTVDLTKVSLDQFIPDRKKPVLMRIHSLCRFGDSFGSLMCDCGPQLIAAKRAIISNGSGMIIYLEQEGRNAGLTAKAAAYRLDAVEKIPTDKTFNELGLDRSDLRDYHVVLDIFSVFNINKAELMTNNPKKFSLLTSAGIKIIQRPISIPATEHNLHYLMTKKNHMGHEHLAYEKKSSNENHIKIANILNEIPQVINEKNMSNFQKTVDEEKEKNNKEQSKQARIQQQEARAHEFAVPLEYCAFFDDVKHPEYHFLSNFYESPISSFLGVFKCSEGLYQYQKFMHLNDPFIKEMFQKSDGQTAYILSRKLASKTVENWDRIAAMKFTLRAKFKDPILKEKLLSTGRAYLVENSHKGHDLFWADNGDGTGKNMMGILLMELRNENGGIGVVTAPNSLKLFYSSKCSKCGDPTYFNNSGYLDSLCPLHKSLL